jgi:predicted AAA+ superfamily ATPase
MQDEEITGQIVEGIILSHLIMNQEIPMMKESSTFLWFYYDKKGKEIDNIIRIVDSNLAIEVKYQKDVTPKDILILSQVDNHIILTKEDFKIQEKVLLAPVDMFLALLTKSDRTL